MEILPIPEFVAEVDSQSLSYIITDLRTRRWARIRRETFKELLKSAGIPCRYFCRRSFATWNVQLPSEELAGSNVSTKHFRLQPEYRGTRSIPPPGPALDYGTKYNPSGSQPGLNDTSYGTPFATTLSASLQSLCYDVEKQIESSLQESDHTLPCPTLWFFKRRADDHVWKEEGVPAAEDWNPKGIYCKNKNKKNTTPISAVGNNKKVS